MLTCQQVILYGKKVDLSRGLAIFIDFISEGRGQRIKKASANRRHKPNHTWYDTRPLPGWTCHGKHPTNNIVVSPALFFLRFQGQFQGMPAAVCIRQFHRQSGSAAENSKHQPQQTAGDTSIQTIGFQPLPAIYIVDPLP